MILNRTTVINDVFVKELGFDLKKFEKLKKEKYFNVEFSYLNTSLIRSTVVQSCPTSQYMKKFLENNTTLLKNILVKPIKRGKQPEYIEDGVKVIKTINIQRSKIDFEEVQFVSEDFLLKNEEKAGIYQYDLLLTSTGMGRGKFALYEEDEICFADSHISIIRFNHEMFLPAFLNYFCQSVFGIEQLKYIEMHIKGTPEIYETQLNDFRIPKFTLGKQQEIIDKIKIEIDKEEEIEKQTRDSRLIINEIFARELEFNENLYNVFGKGMTYGTQIAQHRKLKVFQTEFKELSKSTNLRLSTRFHNLPTRELISLLYKIDSLLVKDIITEPIHRGASPKYDPDGEIPVVKTGHLQNGYLEITQDEFVEQDFYNTSKRSQIRKDDVLIASTGKGSLGKVVLVETEQELVADGHISIIRIDDSRYNPLFFVYFFRSILGYFQIERDFTGATNQIELSANEISNFKIPNISLNRQKKIVNEIKTELDRQEEIKKQLIGGLSTKIQ